MERTEDYERFFLRMKALIEKGKDINALKSRRS